MFYKFGILFLIVVNLCMTLALPSCICTREEKPVCGSNGKTYGNMCMLNCAQSSDPSITLLRVGNCEGSGVPNEVTSQRSVDLASCACPRVAKYVCGSDGNTYGNACVLDCASSGAPGLHVQHTGPCDNSVKVVENAHNLSCSCGRILLPVCASNGVTFDNECELRCAGTHLTVQHMGLCERN